MQKIAREAAVVGDVEVAVGEQQRHLVRRPFGQLELSLALVSHDPETRETRVDVEARHAHHVVVVPEHRGALLVRIHVEHRLARRGDVLRPAVARGGGHAAMEVDDRVPRQRRGGRVGRAAAAARQALGRHAVDRVLGRDRDDDGQRAREAVLPEHLEADAAAHLDRRAGHGSVVGPDPRGREVAMEAMRRGLEPDDESGRAR